MVHSNGAAVMYIYHRMHGSAASPCQTAAVHRQIHSRQRRQLAQVAQHDTGLLRITVQQDTNSTITNSTCLWP